MESGESRSAGYYCHKCNLTVQVPSTDLCPLCNDGFIEKLNPSSISSFADRNNEHSDDTELLPSILRHASDNFEVIVQGGDSSQGSLSDHRPSSSNRRDAASDAAERNDRRRTRNQNYANSFEHVFSELLNTMTRPNAANLDGNAPLFLLSNPPGDYAWGREGLDTIVTQLLNQMDSSGPPPLSNDKIEAIPFVVVTDAQVSENTQCSVCWESFKSAEYVRQLPCEHIYHDACILPWLQLHGTCPICRKLLCDDNDSRLGFSHTGNLEALFSNVPGFSIYPRAARPSGFRLRRFGGRNPHVRCWSCNNYGHFARDCYRRNQPRRAPQPTSENGAGDEPGAPVYAEAPPLEPHAYVDIDDLEEDDDDDDDDDLYDALSDYTDLHYGSEFSDFDFDVLSFSGASSGSAHQPLSSATASTGSGWPTLASTTATLFGEAHPRRFRCFVCGAVGHKANECRLNRPRSVAYRAPHPTAERCRHCGRRNHLSDRCYYRPDGDGSSAPAFDGAQASADSQRARHQSPSPSDARRLPARPAPRTGFGRSRSGLRLAPAKPPRLSSPEPSRTRPPRMRSPRMRPQHPARLRPPHPARLRSPPPPRLVTPPPQLPWSLGRARGSSGASSNSVASNNAHPTASHPRREPICFKCHQPGHVVRNCVSDSDMRGCWRCGETGHLSRDCPLSM